MLRLLEFSQFNEATRTPRTLTKGWVNIVTGQIIEWTDMDQYHAMYMLKNLDKFRNIEYTELWGLLGDETLDSLETGELDRYDVEQYMNFVHSRGWFGYFVGKDMGGVYVDNLRQAQVAVKALEKKGYSYSSIFTRPSKYESDGFAVTIANKKPFKEYFLQDAQMWKHFVRTGKILDTSKRSEIGNTMAMFRESKLQEKTYAKSGLGKWMNQQSAGGGAGWDRYGTEGQKLGKCGDAKEGEPYSACLSRQKAEKLGKKGIASFVRRKREAQKEAGRDDIGDGGKGQKPVYVKTGVADKDPKKQGIQDDWSAKYKRSIDCDNPKGFSQRAHCQGRLKGENMRTFSEFSRLSEEDYVNEPTDPGLYAKVKAEVKKKFDVYPSAYANAFLAKEYKRRGGKWRRVNKSFQESEGEDKPLIKWFDEFERQLKKAGGDYANVKPTDMLKLYYKGVNPRDAAKQLKEEDCGCGCDEIGYEEEIDEAIVVDGLDEIIIQEEGKEKKVDLNNPFRTPDGPKKFSVYVKNDKGNVVKVNFGDPKMSIQRDHEERLKSFRARHGCDEDPGPKWKAKYWSCKFWEKGSPITKLLKDKEVD